MATSLPPRKGFAELARKLNLSPEAITMLVVIARHGDKSDPRITSLLERLNGDARCVANRLIAQTQSNSSESVDMLANVIQNWAKKSVPRK